MKKRSGPCTEAWGNPVARCCDMTTQRTYMTGKTWTIEVRIGFWDSLLSWGFTGGSGGNSYCMFPSTRFYPNLVISKEKYLMETVKFDWISWISFGLVGFYLDWYTAYAIKADGNVICRINNELQMSFRSFYGCNMPQNIEEFISGQYFHSVCTHMAGKKERQM